MSYANNNGLWLTRTQDVFCTHELGIAVFKFLMVSMFLKNPGVAYGNPQMFFRNAPTSLRQSVMCGCFRETVNKEIAFNIDFVRNRMISSKSSDLFGEIRLIF
jgi:hypothetical protein